MKISKILLSSFVLGAFLSSDAGNLSATVVLPGGKLSAPVHKDPGIPRDLVLAPPKYPGQNTGIVSPEMSQRARLLGACKELEQAKGLDQIAKAREHLKQMLERPPLPQSGVKY